MLPNFLTALRKVKNIKDDIKDDIQDEVYVVFPDSCKSLSKKDIVLMIDNFSSFDRFIKDFIERYYHVWCQFYGYHEFEEVESYEILNKKVLATVSFVCDSKDLRSRTFNFPVDYLVSGDDWIKVEEENLQKALDHRSAMNDF